MVAPFLVSVVGTGYNVSGNNDERCPLHIVAIFDMAFLDQVLGIHNGYYVLFFYCLPSYYFFSERSGKNFDHFISALSINLWCWENISDAPSYGMACTSTKN